MLFFSFLFQRLWTGCSAFFVLLMLYARLYGFITIQECNLPTSLSICSDLFLLQNAIHCCCVFVSFLLSIYYSLYCILLCCLQPCSLLFRYLRFCNLLYFREVAMSFMKGDLLTRTRKLVKGLAMAEPRWLKAMEQLGSSVSLIIFSYQKFFFI